LHRKLLPSLLNRELGQCDLELSRSLPENAPLTQQNSFLGNVQPLGDGADEPLVVGEGGVGGLLLLAPVRAPVAVVKLVQGKVEPFLTAPFTTRSKPAAVAGRGGSLRLRLHLSHPGRRVQGRIVLRREDVRQGGEGADNQKAGKGRSQRLILGFSTQSIINPSTVIL
jgi:hypothetical protein